MPAVFYPENRELTIAEGVPNGFVFPRDPTAILAMPGEPSEPKPAWRASVRYFSRCLVTKSVSKSGRRRRGAIAVIVERGRFLVIRRSQGVVAPGMHCFPGGGIEGGETESEALIREMREELGVAVVPLTRLWSSTTSWGTELAWWHATLAPGATLQANADEVESFDWLSADELLAVESLLSSNREFMAAWQRGEFSLPMEV